LKQLQQQPASLLPVLRLLPALLLRLLLLLQLTAVLMLLLGALHLTLLLDGQQWQKIALH
jgi:hypothetical protein